MIPKPKHYKLFAAACALHVRAKKSADIALEHERNGDLQAAANSRDNAAMFAEVSTWLDAESTAMREAEDKREDDERKLFDTPLRGS